MSTQTHDASGCCRAAETQPTTETFLSVPDGICIFLRAWIPAQLKRLVICVQGLGGHGGYYARLAAWLVPEGIGVIAPDLRGHGRSMGRRGDIDHFARYLEDVDATVGWARVRWPATPVILLGESMGASIALRYVAGTHPRPDAASMAGLALLAPVFQPGIQAIPREVVRFVHAALSGPSRPLLPVTGREELGCRDQAFNERLRADPLFVRHVSARFIVQLSWWLWHTRHSAAQVSCPLLVLRGEQDHVAHPSGTARFLERMATAACTAVTIPDAYHCLLFDPATPAAMAALISWLETLPADSGATSPDYSEDHETDRPPAVSGAH